MFLFSHNVCFSQAISENDTITDNIDSFTVVTIDSINIRGNKKTKDHIILRELTFATGDTLTQAELLNALEQSRINLIKTSLFLDVNIETDFSHTGAFVCIITVSERWYIFPKPQLDLADRNFNVWWYEKDHDPARLEYGVDLLCYNFTGNNDLLEIKAIAGFTRKAEVFYNKPYITKRSAFGWGAFVSWSRNTEINYITLNNKHIFFEGQQYVENKFRTGLQLTRRDNIFYYSELEVKYNQNQIADIIADLNPDYLLDGNTLQKFFTITGTFTDDHTDDKAYPLRGHYGKAYIQKPGLGFTKNLADRESSVNQLILYGQYNQYAQLSDNLFAGAMLSVKLRYGNDFPYNIYEGLGYCENFVRGYEYYVIDGEDVFLLRSNIKTRLFSRNFNNPITSIEVFEHIPLAAYFKLFADAGYVTDHTYDQHNFLTNRMQYSAGAGFDLTTFYDWVFRFEYAVNALGEFGLYLHLALDLNTYEDCNLW